MFKKMKAITAFLSIVIFATATFVSIYQGNTLSTISLGILAICSFIIFNKIKPA